MKLGFSSSLSEELFGRSGVLGAWIARNSSGGSSSSSLSKAGENNHPASLSFSCLCANPTFRTSLRSSIGKLLSTCIFGGDYSIDL
jgi:hypothetical protein